MINRHGPAVITRFRRRHGAAPAGVPGPRRRGGARPGCCGRQDNREHRVHDPAGPGRRRRRRPCPRPYPPSPALHLRPAANFAGPPGNKLILSLSVPRRPATDRRCQCGHARGAHAHYRPGSECSLCRDCSHFRAAGGLAEQMARLIRRLGPERGKVRRPRTTGTDAK